MKTCICVLHLFKAPHVRGDPAVGPGDKVQTPLTWSNIWELLFLLEQDKPGPVVTATVRAHSLTLPASPEFYVCVCACCSIQAEEASMIRLGEKKGWELKIPLTFMSLYWAGSLLLLAGIASSVSSSALITDTGLSLKQWVYFRTLWHCNSLKSLCSKRNVQYKYIYI